MTGSTIISFEDLDGWEQEDHKAALAAFRHSARYLRASPPTTREGSAKADDLLHVARQAQDMPQECDQQSARTFFERHFIPHLIGDDGFLTGYYEPQFEASLTRTEHFCHPLHRRPKDLHPIDAATARKAGLSDETSFARQTTAGWTYHASRREVYAGALESEDLELVYLASPIDAYIIHIQGSAKLILPDGRFMRVAFDGKSGHAYQSLGKILIEQGIFTAETITMDRLTGHLRALGSDAYGLLAQNPSYIYFKPVEGADSIEGPFDGPIAAASIPLVARRSLAVDRKIHTFGLPFWIETTLPAHGSEDISTAFNHLLFAHDTGSAIKGAARGDLYVGSGSEAGRLAGSLKQPARFVCLMPIGQNFDGQNSDDKNSDDKGRAQ